MRSFVCLALLCCVLPCAGATEPPQAPSAVLAAAGPAPSAPEAAPEFSPELTAAALSLPIRGLAGYSEAALASPSLLVPAISPVSPKTANRAKVMDKRFLFMIGAGTALTVLDYEMTLSCMSRRVCREANPILPTTRSGMYISNLPLNAALYYWSYKRRASGKRLWWVAPLAIIGSHAAGVASNVPFVGKPAR